MFPAGAPAPEFVDPMLSNPMRSNGAKAWFGWPDDPKLEAAYNAWLDAPNDAERRKLEATYQLAAFEFGADHSLRHLHAACRVAIQSDRSCQRLAPRCSGAWRRRKEPRPCLKSE